MANNFIQPGQVLDYVNNTAAAIMSGDVVVAGAILGIALKDIPVGATESVRIEGVFKVPKSVGSAIAQGQAVTYDLSAKAFVPGTAAPAAGDVSGSAVAFNAAASADTFVNVKFTGVPGVVAA